MARFEDGTGTTITLANGTTLWEVSITPPSFEGGGEIDTTTLRNTTMRTKQPKVLKELGECSFSAAYDTSHLTTLYGQVNTNAAISISFPDGASILFWGFIDSVSV